MHLYAIHVHLFCVMLALGPLFFSLFISFPISQTLASETCTYGLARGCVSYNIVETAFPILKKQTQVPVKLPVHLLQ